MYTIHALNVNHALARAIPYLLEVGVPESSRNGPVLVAPGPVVTVYAKPQQRVLFGEMRDANPFFHLMEALWMLAGRDDLEFPAFFNKNFSAYSDNGKTVRGAYGFRWRKGFGFDQIVMVADELIRNPESRRAVLQMWSAPFDLCVDSKDIPCNTHIYFDLRGGKLNMAVCNRSNDIIWGTYGANAVHFSILQEYVAAMVGKPMGIYHQYSNNFHIYTNTFDLDKLKVMASESLWASYYTTSQRQPSVLVKPYPLVSTPIKEWDADLQMFMEYPRTNKKFNDPFFTHVAQPMFNAWYDRKTQRGTGLSHIADLYAEDWRLACTQWIARRERKH